jgi:putative transposase
MARASRVVLPGVVYYITQRGVRSMDIFYHYKDRLECLYLLNRRAERTGLQFIAYCLMTNHVHLSVIPSNEDRLRLGIGEAIVCTIAILILERKQRDIYFKKVFFMPII